MKCKKVNIAVTLGRNLRFCQVMQSLTLAMEQRFKNVNNYLNTNIDSYLEKSGGQSSKLYFNVVHFFQHQC
jgi:hypothetical protein